MKNSRTLRKEAELLKGKLLADGYSIAGWCRKNKVNVGCFENLFRPDRSINPRSTSVDILLKLRKDFSK